jgi:ABC-type uncharacterized transport system auxiliary subunit
MLPNENVPLTRLAKTILVQTVEIDPVYDDFRIVYKISPYELNYYPYEFWVKNPGAVVRDAIFEFLANRSSSGGGTFQKVIQSFSEGNPDYILEATVDIIEEYDYPASWFAHLKMSIRIKDFLTNETVLVHCFDRMEKLSEKKVEQIPIGISKILEEELVIMLSHLREKIV